MNKINRIFTEYEKARKEHFFLAWMNYPALIERIFYSPQKDHPNYEKTRQSDFLFDKNFLVSVVEKNTPNELELDSWIFYLKIHCSRINNRINFLLVYVAFAGVVASICKILNMDIAALLIISAGLLGTILERNMLVDKKSITEELVLLLEHKKSKKHVGSAVLGS